MPCHPLDTAGWSRLPPAARWLTIAVSAYAAYLLLLYLKQDGLLFFPEMAGPGSAPPRGVVLLQRVIPEGTVEAWLLPADRPGRAPLAVLCHGNAEGIDQQLEWAEGYRQMGFAVLLPEFRGYGRSAGRPTERAIDDDAAWFVEQALARPDVDPARVVYHGRSLGGGVVGGLAARRAPQALVLQSTFTSVAVMARGYLAPPFLVRNPFHTDRVLPGLNCPVLVFHGSRDQLIPPEHGRRLATLARRGTLVEYPAGHNDFPGVDHVEDYWMRLSAFLDQAGLGDGQ